MQNSKIEETIIFFPLMQLKQSYSLQYGKIGPLSELHNDHPTLKKLALALKLTIIDGEQLDDPVVALSVSDHKKFIGEIECLAFLACSEKEALAEDEIFSQKTMFTVTRNNGVEFICLNRNACFSVDRIEALRFQDFPTQYIRWDHEKIAELAASDSDRDEAPTRLSRRRGRSYDPESDGS